LKFAYAISGALIVCSTWLLWPETLDFGLIRDDGEETSLMPDYYLKNFRYASVKQGKREMEVVSTEATLHLEKQMAKGAQVTAYFYDLKGERTTLVGDRGKLDLGRRHLRVESNVRSVSPDGFTMLGSEADYYLDKRLLLAKAPVEGFTQAKDIKIWALEVESLIDTNTANFRGDVRTEYKAANQPLLKVRGDRAVLGRTEKIVSYFDNVKMNQDKLVMTSGEARLNYGQAGKNTGALRYLVANKDVTIHETAERYSQSQMAEFYSDTNSIVLTGFPSVIEGKDTVTGDKLTLFRSTGVVEVTAANAAFSEDIKRRGSSHDKLSGEDLELFVEEKPGKSPK
jgi:lipopolysaccharide export system protein LptA